MLGWLLFPFITPAVTSYSRPATIPVLSSTETKIIEPLFDGFRGQNVLVPIVSFSLLELLLLLSMFEMKMLEIKYYKKPTAEIPLYYFISI